MAKQEENSRPEVKLTLAEKIEAMRYSAGVRAGYKAAQQGKAWEDRPLKSDLYNEGAKWGEAYHNLDEPMRREVEAADRKENGQDITEMQRYAIKELKAENDNGQEI